MNFVPGQMYRRTELHKQFGGQRQGGISTPAKFPFVLLITGDSGRQHGYRDEWTDEGHFLYTGEGQSGDMRFVAGNRAIRDHENEGKSLELFEQDKKDKRYLRYIGEMKYAGHHLETRPDTAGKNRQAIVFHLQPAEATATNTPMLEAALAPELDKPKSRRSGGGFGSAENNRKVEQAAIQAVTKSYEAAGWTVVSKEREKIGYDLQCTKGQEEEHVEVKGTQGDEVEFIITRGEVRNVNLDRRHVTLVVTDALSEQRKIHRFDKQRFQTEIELEPIAFRASLKITAQETTKPKAKAAKAR